MDDIDNQVLTVNIRKLRTDSFKYICHGLTWFIIRPFWSEKIGVEITKNIYKDNFYYYVYKTRNWKVEL